MRVLINLIILLSVLAIGFFTGIYICHATKDTTSSDNIVRKGEVWVYEYDTKNPFEKRKDTLVVIDVKNGYVEYSQRGTLESSTVEYFLIGSRKIK